MKSILHEFAYGNINPAEHSIPKTQHYKRTLKKLNEYDNTLQSLMDDKVQEIFKLGMLMTVEVFVGKNSVVFGGEDG